MQRVVGHVAADDVLPALKQHAQCPRPRILAPAGVDPGTLFTNNVCFNSTSYGYGGWGYYDDEGTSNVTWQFNIVYATKSAGLHQHYGENNVIVNNVIADPGLIPCDGAAGCDNAAVRSSQVRSTTAHAPFQPLPHLHVVRIRSSASSPLLLVAAAPTPPGPWFQLVLHVCAQHRAPQ